MHVAKIQLISMKGQRKTGKIERIIKLTNVISELIPKLKGGREINPFLLLRLKLPIIYNKIVYHLGLDSISTYSVYKLSCKLNLGPSPDLTLYCFGQENQIHHARSAKIWYGSSSIHRAWAKRRKVPSMVFSLTYSWVKCMHVVWVSEGEGREENRQWKMKREK